MTKQDYKSNIFYSNRDITVIVSTPKNLSNKKYCVKNALLFLQRNVYLWQKQHVQFGTYFVTDL